MFKLPYIKIKWNTTMHSQFLMKMFNQLLYRLHYYANYTKITLL